ncbi:MAG: hypothetical protein VSS75_032535 [Candidatus Parabeggiatoa sp.]|nr:hypothetical protein [Candidatus Parabeggiatoa sp.]
MQEKKLVADNKTLKDEQFDLDYKPDPTVVPKELAGNANLSLHHHMSPPDGYDEDE